MPRASDQMVEYAGLSERVSVEIGSLSEKLPAIHRKYGVSGALDAVLLERRSRRASTMAEADAESRTRRASPRHSIAPPLCCPRPPR